MRARAEELATVLDTVSRAIVHLPQFHGGHAFYLHEMPAAQRQFLKENHLISNELEKGGIGRAFLVSPDIRLGAMINEEDHLRLFALRTGLRPAGVLDECIEFDASLQAMVEFAYDEQLGFLTACPTNTGTGLRLSVMLHVPGLSALRKLPEIASKLPAMGLIVRGFHGENSEFLGDYCQVSNEVTLGVTEQEIAARLVAVVDEIIQHEERTRQLLIKQNRLQIEDETWRAFGLLTHARTMPTNEALNHLSKLRLGIDLGFLPALTHADLTRLTVAIHPAHIALAFPTHDVSETEVRDRLRADMLRQVLSRG
jgi:protein arginine kinase